uniref:SFRICE_007107 n=1 Tax=Spodoptera frugiperda TaxID=7108 RepID=A0A2H1W995_SPOFR
MYALNRVEPQAPQYISMYSFRAATRREVGVLHVHEVVLRHATRRPRVSVFRGRSRASRRRPPSPTAWHGSPPPTYIL